MRRRLALLLMLGFTVVHAAESDAPRPPPLRVMLLVPSDLLLPSAVYQTSITKAAIEEAVPREVEFYAEGLDALRLQGADHESEFVALVRKRYASLTPDLIVAHGPMHGFVSRHRAHLWPQRPWMFVGVSQGSLQSPDFPRDIPGTSGRFDVSGTVDLALGLQPEAKRLVVVAGSAQFDRLQVQNAARLLEPYRERLDIQYLPQESLGAMARRLAALPRDSIILQLPVTRDATGRVYVPGDTLTVLAAAAGAPSYDYYDRSVDMGVVGGSMVNWPGQKEMIGKIARELLLGEPRQESLRMHAPVPSLCTVDWRQIVRWRLPATRIPQNCTIVHREPGFWERYYKQALLVGFVLLVQFGLIVALLVQRRRRHQAEVEISHQRSQLLHAARLATVGELSASIAHEITQPLAAILTNTETAEYLLDSDRGEKDELRKILGAIRKDNQRATSVIDRLRRLLRQEEVATQLLDANEIVDAIVRLVAGNARRNAVVIDRALDAAVPRVTGDAVQLQQVLLNLMMNAIEAMREVPPERRRLRIETAERPQGSVEICVSDGGPGIAPELVDRVFEPFVSTKPNGMGLGLSISRSIVSAHGGRLSVESTAMGSAFRFTIPAETRDRASQSSE